MAKGYDWKGMEKLSLEKIRNLHDSGQLAGCYYLYPDNTEAQIESGYDFDEIIAFCDRGGEIGVEIDTVDLTLADGKPVKAPKYVDLSQMGCLDELEYDLWDTIRAYMLTFGIRPMDDEDDEPDWATVKAVQDSILDVFSQAGVNFVFAKGDNAESVRKKGPVLVKKVEGTVCELMKALYPYRGMKVSLMGSSEDIFIYHDAEQNCISLDEKELEELYG